MPGIEHQRRRLLRTVPAEVLAVHRAVHALNSLDGTLHGEPALYRQPHIVRDVIRYRAAAISLTHAATDAWT